MPSLQSRVLDLGLNVLDTETTHLYLCSQEPTTYTEATSTYALGNNNFGAGGAFGAPAARAPNGRSGGLHRQHEQPPAWQHRVERHSGGDRRQHVDASQLRRGHSRAVRAGEVLQWLFWTISTPL
jgi:hypothetical protein